MLFAEGLGEKELYSKLLEVRQKIHASFLDHVDLSKTGIYTDETKSKVYFIGKIRAPQIKSISMRRTVRDTNIRGEALRMLAERFGKKWPSLNHGATFGMNFILIADTSKDGQIINFLFEVGGIAAAKDGDITSLLLINLFEEKSFVPFK